LAALAVACLLRAGSAGGEQDIVRLSLPFPSGIIVDSVPDGAGNVYLFGRLQLNAVQMRPSWSNVYSMDTFLPLSTCNDIIERADGTWTTSCGPRRTTP
jgi:hypothetical protein